MALGSTDNELIIVKMVAPADGSLLVIKGEAKIKFLIRESSKIIIYKMLVS